MLSDKGVKQGLTKEKIDGTYKRPKDITEQNLAIWREDYLVEFIKKYFDQYPDMFQKEKDLKDKLLKVLKGARIKLRKYPDVIRAMFQDCNPDEIPEDLRIEENKHESILIQEHEEHMSRR